MNQQTRRYHANGVSTVVGKGVRVPNGNDKTSETVFTTGALKLKEFPIGTQPSKRKKLWKGCGDAAGRKRQ